MANSGGNRSFINGEKMKSILQTERDMDLGGKFENMWGVWRIYTLTFTKKKTPRSHLFCAEDWRSCGTRTQSLEVVRLILSTCFLMVLEISNLNIKKLSSNVTLATPIKPSASVFNSIYVQTRF